MSSLEIMMTTTEVARLLRVHPNTVRQWANNGLLRAYHLGTRRDRRFKREDVDNFLNADNGNGHDNPWRAK